MTHWCGDPYEPPLLPRLSVPPAGIPSGELLWCPPPTLSPDMDTLGTHQQHVVTKFDVLLLQQSPWWTCGTPLVCRRRLRSQPGSSSPTPSSPSTSSLPFSLAHSCSFVSNYCPKFTLKFNSSFLSAPLPIGPPHLERAWWRRWQRKLRFQLGGERWLRSSFLLLRCSGSFLWCSRAFLRGTGTFLRSSSALLWRPGIKQLRRPSSLKQLRHAIQRIRSRETKAIRQVARWSKGSLLWPQPCRHRPPGPASPLCRQRSSSFSARRDSPAPQLDRDPRQFSLRAHWCNETWCFDCSEV